MRAIDADALKEDLTRFYDNEVTARKLIDEQPTIQPEPKRGKWIKGNDGYIRCSECGCRASAIKARFCHRCGADMRQ